MRGRYASWYRSPIGGCPPLKDGVGEGADRPVDRGLLQQPARLFLERLNRVDPVPDDVIWRNGSDGFDDCLVAAENCEEVAVADDLDRPFGGAPQRGVVDGRDCRVAAWVAQGDGSNGRYHTTSDWMCTSLRS
jgi:hypothetical protein